MKESLRNGTMQFYVLLVVFILVTVPFTYATFDGENEQDAGEEKTREEGAGPGTTSGGDSEEEGTPITIATPPSSGASRSTASVPSTLSVPYGIQDHNMLRDLSGSRLEGQVGSFETSLYSGAATYVYSIKVPSGINGLEPDVSLVYNHHAIASRGPMGNGWALSVASISRDTNGTLANTSDDEFFLSFMGGTAKLVYDAGDSSYHTEVESYWNIRQQGDAWEVRTRDGTRYRFGSTDDAKLSSTEQPFTSVWSLDIVNDTHGNQMQYTYNERLGGDYYPYLSEISYNSGLAKVRFLYHEGAVNGTLGYRQGTRVNQTALLTDVEVLYNNALVRRIALDYLSRDASRLLSGITLIGSDNRTALPPINFTYADPAKGWAQNTSLDLPQGAYLGEQKDNGVRFIDINADGYDDIMRMSDSSALDYWFNTKSGWGQKQNVSNFLPGGFVEKYGQDTGVRFFDINSDAAADIIKVVQDGNVTQTVKLNARDSWQQQSFAFPPNVSFVKGKAGDTCSPASCPSGTTQVGGVSCVNGLCSRTCEYQSCSSSGTVVVDSSSDNAPDWNDYSYDEEDRGDSFTPSSNKCYTFEFTGSQETDNDDSQCYDLYTDNANSRNSYGRDCEGRDIDAYAGVGFIGDGSSSTWLSTVPGGSNYGYIGNQYNPYWDYRYLSKYGYDGSPDTSGDNEGDWDGFNDIICDEGGTQSIACAPSSAICSVWGASRCGYDCSGETTRPFVVIGVYADYNNNLGDALDDNWDCDSDIDDNDYFAENNHYKVTEYAVTTNSYPNSCEYIPYVYNNTGARLGDLNADGKVDLLQGTESVSAVWLNNGSGFSAVSSWSLPNESRFLSAGKDAGTRIADVNGDGLPDLVKGIDSTRKTWLNTGERWLEDAAWAVPSDAVFIRNGEDNGVAFLDINSDGLGDLVQATPTDRRVWLNTGRGWSLSSSWSLPTTANLKDASTAIAEINGDGMVDIVIAKTDAARTVWTNNAAQANLLVSVRNSQGGILRVSYAKMAGKDNTGSDDVSDLPFNGWVVESSIADNGMTGEFGVTTTNRYSYVGGFYEPQTQEFRGFAEVTEQRSDGAVITHLFHQDAARKGLEYETSLSSQGQPYQKAESAFASHVNHSVDVVRLGAVKLSLFDGATSSPKVTRTSFTYDTYGNPTDTLQEGDLAGTGDELSVSVAYQPNTEAWILGLPVKQETFGPDGEKLRETRFRYDAQGDLIEETRYLNTSATSTTQYGYDSRGNLISSVDALGYETSYSYEGAFLVSSTNALGQVTSSVYNQATGNLLSTTDSNGNRKQWDYDVFGRPTKKALPYDSMDAPTLSYNYSFDGLAPERVTTWTRINLTTAVYLDTFSDGIGQVYRAVQQADRGNLTSEMKYDSLGRVSFEYYPYYAGDSRLGVTYEYDPLGRVLKRTAPDSTSRRGVYTHWKLTSYDENDRKIEQEQDAYGRTVSVTEFNGAESYVTRYAYAPLGELLSITDSQGNVFSYIYDSFGRKTRMNDPDLGVWVYTYDTLGNLVAQTDAANHTLSLSYDSLGRITEKSAGSDTFTYAYDRDKNGTLTEISASGWSKAFEYDDRLRVVKETLTIDGRAFATSYLYNARDSITSKMFPDRSTESFVYSSEGLLVSLPGVMPAIEYNALGLPTKRKYANLLETVVEYRPDNLRLKSISTAALQNFSYTFDKKGNLLKLRDGVSNVTSAFSYDSLDRLANASRPDKYDLSYQYDRVGNLLNVTGAGLNNISYLYAGLAHSPEYILLDYAPPRILSSQATPPVQGFGEPVEISANVERLNLTESGFISVLVATPNGWSKNFSMNGTGGEWKTRFTAFRAGVYNYTLIVGDVRGIQDQSLGSFELNTQLEPIISARERCYPDESLTLEAPSTIANTGSANATLWVRLEVQRLSDGEWVTERVISDTKERILANRSLNVSARWGPWNCGNATRIPGDYRVAVFARDDQGTVLLHADGSAVTSYDSFTLRRIPVVLNVTSVNRSDAYGLGENLLIDIGFNERVQVNETPVLALNVGSSASYITGSGTNTLTFVYTVGARANTLRLDYSNASALKGGSITDHYGKKAILTLPAPGGANSLVGSKNLSIDTLAPQIQFVLERGRSDRFLLKGIDNLDSAPRIQVQNRSLSKKTTLVKVRVEDSAGNARELNYTQPMPKGLRFVQTGNTFNYSHTSNGNIDLTILSIASFNGATNISVYPKDSGIFSTPSKSGVTLVKDAQLFIVKKSKNNYRFEEDDYINKKMRTVRTEKHSFYSALVLTTQGAGFNATVLK